LATAIEVFELHDKQVESSSFAENLKDHHLSVEEQLNWLHLY
jgi:hypothetical protein